MTRVPAWPRGLLLLSVLCGVAPVVVHAEEPPPLDPSAAPARPAPPAAPPVGKAQPAPPGTTSTPPPTQVPPFPPGDVSVRAYVDPDRVLLGDKFNFVVEVRHPAGHKVELPESITWGKLESAGSVQHQLRNDDTPGAKGGVVETFRFPLQAFKLGQVETPSLTLRIPGLSVDEGTLTVDALPVTVQGLMEGKPEKELAPMAPPVALMKEDPRFLAWPPLLILHGLLWLLVRWLDGKRPARITRTAAVPVVVIPPHRVALEKLEALKKSGLLEAGKREEFVDTAVQIVREYLEAAYQVPVLEQTTAEALSALGPAVVKATLVEERRRLGRLDMEAVRKLLTFADAIKFAKGSATVADCARILDESVQIIETTRPLGAGASDAVVKVQPAQPEVTS
ncbi:MAG: hypothetical protein AB2A00_12005 [Myxococcota bacterium]